MAAFRFSAREHEIIYRLGQVMIPAGKIFPPFYRDLSLKIERKLAESSPTLGQAFRGMLWTLEESSRLRYLRPCSKLVPAKRLAYLMSWAHGSYPQRLALRLVSGAIKIAYYDDPGLFEQIGVDYYKPPVKDEPARWMQQVMPGDALTEDTELEAEVVVVGTGAGGAVVAAELAAAGNAVVMIEEGDYTSRSQYSGRPFDMQALLYRNMGLTATVGNTSMVVPVGCTVGGTTTINSGTCFRTPRRTLRRWREQYGLTDFTPKAMESYFQRVEAVYQVTDAEMKYVGPNGTIIARGAERLGYSHGPLPRCAPDCDGQGVCCFGCPTDAKRSTNVSYVPRALENNAYLVAGTCVDRILIDQGRAVGVSGLSNKTGKRLTVKASVVVLACGTFYTPLMLMKHKLGARSGQLGKNLSIHPASNVGALVDESVEAWKTIPQGYMVDEFDEEGIMLEGATLPLDFTAMFVPDIGRSLQELMENYTHLASFGFMIEDTSRGVVRPGAAGMPLISYFVNKQDLGKILRGIEILSRVYLAAGARKIMPPVFGWDPIFSETDLEANLTRKVHARDVDLSAFHPLGTCSMGDNPDRSVTGPYGEMWDVPNLFVCDGSAVPPALGVNPQITIGALATRTADYISDRLKTLSQI